MSAVAVAVGVGALGKMNGLDEGESSVGLLQCFRGIRFGCVLDTFWNKNLRAVVWELSMMGVLKLVLASGIL